MLGSLLNRGSRGVRVAAMTAARDIVPTNKLHQIHVVNEEVQADRLS